MRAKIVQESILKGPSKEEIKDSIYKIGKDHKWPKALKKAFKLNMHDIIPDIVKKIEQSSGFLSLDFIDEALPYHIEIYLNKNRGYIEYGDYIDSIETQSDSSHVEEEIEYTEGLMNEFIRDYGGELYKYIDSILKQIGYELNPERKPRNMGFAEIEFYIKKL